MIGAAQSTRVGLVLGAVLLGLISRPGAQRVAPPTVEALELAVDRLRADRAYPAPAATDAADEACLTAALHTSDDAVRAVAVRALGRFEEPRNVAALLPFLDDPNQSVRVEAGNAVALSLRRATAADAAPVLQGILTRLADPASAEPWLYDTLGRLPYARPDAARIEAALVAGIMRSLDPTLVEEALVAFVGRDRMRPVAAATRDLLLARARGTESGPPSLQAWRALQILTIAGPNAAPLLLFGASYHCADSPECGWKIREIATDLIDPTDPNLIEALDQAREDPSVAVRLAAVRRIARALQTTHHCAPLLDTLADPGQPEIVRLEAISLLDPRCADRDAVVARLTTLVHPLTRLDARSDWHQSARALETLARFDADQTRTIARAVVTHPVWQVRAAAARAAATIKDEATLVRFADDRTPNVVTEALKGLAGLAPTPSGTLVPLARRALANPDYQVVREAAEALKKAPPDPADAPELLQALARLTAEGKDTSRDPRTSILTRLKALAARAPGASQAALGPEAVPVLTPLLADFDPQIAKLTAGVLLALTGTEPPIAPTHRAIDQATEAALRHLPARATVSLGNGQTFDLVFLTTEAPLMIARFAGMVRSGYYTHLTFHRVEPLFVIQGGSPGANEYTGASRFFRDEIGRSHHIAGAVGMSTRGSDTGDGQLFVDLTDQYRLDYQYTVFAQVSDLGPAERLLEGERIERIVIKN